jgi:hypothetical protein
VEKQFGGVFTTIPARSHAFKSHVESFYGRIECEMYERIEVRINTNVNI